MYGVSCWHGGPGCGGSCWHSSFGMAGIGVALVRIVIVLVGIARVGMARAPLVGGSDEACGCIVGANFIRLNALGGVLLKTESYSKL